MACPFLVVTASRTDPPDQLRRVGRELLDYLPVGGLDEAVLVDDGIGRQAADKADVGAFRRLDGTDAAVVAVVNVTHVEAGPVTGKAAGAQSGKTPLVRQLRQRVGLVHELGELRPAEELLHRRHDRPDVDQRARCRLVGVGDRHALADHPLHPQEADPELVLDQLSHRPDAPVAQVVDVIGVP